MPDPRRANVLWSIAILGGFALACTALLIWGRA